MDASGRQAKEVVPRLFEPGKLYQYHAPRTWYRELWHSNAKFHEKPVGCIKDGDIIFVLNRGGVDLSWRGSKAVRWEIISQNGFVACMIFGVPSNLERFDEL